MPARVGVPAGHTIGFAVSISIISPKKSFLTIFQFEIFRRDSCLLNLNGNNLLGNLVSIPGVTGGGAGGGGGGILGGLLGGK